MELHKAQKEIAKDTHRFRVLVCGRRFGKTMLAVEEMVGYAIAKKDRRVVYYAPTRDDARDIAWNMLVKKCENIIKYKNEQRLELRIMTIDGGESSIVLYGWESVQERGKGRGLANDFIVLDEVAFYRNFWEGWDEVLSPTLVDKKGHALFISTPKGFNHFYELYGMESKNPDFKSFHFTSYDNPHIPAEEIDRERIAKTDNVFAQEYLADFRKQEGLVYKEFQRARHVYKDATIDVAERLAGIDFGFTNPTAILTILRDRNDVYWVTDELYKTNLTTDAIAEYVISKGYNKIYPDPASPEAIKHLTDKHLNVYEVSKGKDSIATGIAIVRELFKQGRIRIHENCKNLIWELETYAYPERRENNNEAEVPLKENDHAVDALRYCLMTNKPVTTPIEVRHRILNMARRNQGENAW